jgi:hypothetical protein
MVHIHTCITLPENQDMPGWVAPPPKWKRAEQTQAATELGSEADEADHGREDETRIKRGETMIQTADNEHKKRKPSDSESDLNAQEYKSRKKKRETQVTEE